MSLEFAAIIVLLAIVTWKIFDAVKCLKDISEKLSSLASIESHLSNIAGSVERNDPTSGYAFMKMLKNAVTPIEPNESRGGEL